ncbi:MAG: ABC transporter substrate-binding protein [Pseudomonadota bacterium]
MTFLTRRSILASASASAIMGAALPAIALTEARAEALVNSVVTEINGVIASGKPLNSMIRDFERIFARYADVPIIARSALGQDSRRASPAQLRNFTRAFQGYIARKYGRRFREFIGGRVEVTGVRQVKSYVEVRSRVTLRGSSPFDVRFHVSDRSGRDLFFDMLIEGVSLRLSERTEIGAMLDQNGGDFDRLIAAVSRAG